MVFIMLEKDKNYVSPLKDLKPMLPVILIILGGTAAAVVYFSRKSTVTKSGSVNG